jgi:hypothetical protein
MKYIVGGTVDLQKAISAHIRWKAKIALFNDACLDEVLDPKMIGRATSCELGKLLADLPMDVRALPEFAELVLEHRTLHKTAAGLVKRIADGERLPESELGMGSAFAALSSKVIRGLRALSRAMDRARAK